MGRGWDGHVYRTDVTPTKYIGFHFDTDAAQAWVDKQKEGTYEVSQEGPIARMARLDGAAAAAEASGD